MDPTRKQQIIAEKRRHLNQRIQEAQAELAKLDQYEALERELFSGTEEASSGIPTLGRPIHLPSAGALAAQGGVLPVPPGIRGFGRVTKKETILSTAAQILSDGKRRSSKELLEELKARGVDIGGTDPVNNLAAYLSPDERFDSRRSEGGWGLVHAPRDVSRDPILS